MAGASLPLFYHAKKKRTDSTTQKSYLKQLFRKRKLCALSSLEERKRFNVRYLVGKLQFQPIQKRHSRFLFIHLRSLKCAANSSGIRLSHPLKKGIEWANFFS